MHIPFKNQAEDPVPVDPILSSWTPYTVTSNLHHLLGLEINTIPLISVEIVDSSNLVDSQHTPATDDSPPRCHVQLSRPYLESLPEDVRAQEAEGIVYNQIAMHILSSKPMPGWMQAGASDWIRLKVGKPSPGWMEQYGGEYEDGWSTAAYFLEWLDSADRLPKSWALNQLCHHDPSSDDVDVQNLWHTYQLQLLKGPNASVKTYQSRPSEPIMILVDDGQASEAFFAALPDALEFLLEAYLTSTSLLYSPLTAPAKKVDQVTLILSSKYHGVAVTSHSTITLSTLYVNDFSAGHKISETTTEMKGVLLHEMVHVVQYDGRGGKAPGGLIEGIADYCRLRGGLGASHWKRERGGKWDSGYQTTGYFLDWVEKERSEGFVARCNAALKEPWDVEWVKQDSGETWEALWELYQESLEPAEKE